MKWNYNQDVPLGEEVLVQYKYTGTINPALRQDEMRHDALIFLLDDEYKTVCAAVCEEHIYPEHIYRWIRIKDLD